jgi:hypothetical protein
MHVSYLLLILSLPNAGNTNSFVAGEPFSNIEEFTASGHNKYDAVRLKHPFESFPFDRFRCEGLSKPHLLRVSL